MAKQLYPFPYWNLNVSTNESDQTETPRIKLASIDRQRLKIYHETSDIPMLPIQLLFRIWERMYTVRKELENVLLRSNSTDWATAGVSMGHYSNWRIPAPKLIPGWPLKWKFPVPPPSFKSKPTRPRELLIAADLKFVDHDWKTSMKARHSKSIPWFLGNSMITRQAGF